MIIEDCASKKYIPTFKGLKHTDETKEKMRQSVLAERNHNWKSEGVGYITLHQWIRRRMPRPDLCTKCNERKAYDLANITGIYERDLSNWQWLCRKCHMVSDGRMNNLRQYGSRTW